MYIKSDPLGSDPVGLEVAIAKKILSFKGSLVDLRGIVAVGKVTMRDSMLTKIEKSFVVCYWKGVCAGALSPSNCVSQAGKTTKQR